MTAKGPESGIEAMVRGLMGVLGLGTEVMPIEELAAQPFWMQAMMAFPPTAGGAGIMLGPSSKATSAFLRGKIPWKGFSPAVEQAARTVPVEPLGVARPVAPTAEAKTAAAKAWTDLQARLAVKALPAPTIRAALPEGKPVPDLVPKAPAPAAPTLTRGVSTEPAGVAPRDILAASPVGNTVEMLNPDNPNQAFKGRLRLVELDDVQASHTDYPSLQPNADYPISAAQRRNRASVESKSQIGSISQNLAVDSLLEDVGMLQHGSPVVGLVKDRLAAIAGNGRLLALRLAREQVPKQWARYQARLRELAESLGFSSDDLARLKNPVLVREALDIPDDAGWVKLADLSNQETVMSLGTVERALADVDNITTDMLAGLRMGDETNLDQALLRADNRDFVRNFVRQLPDVERAGILTPEGNLNALGLERVKAALFAKVYPGEAGKRLTSIFFESAEPEIRTLEQGLFASLPRMALVEGLIKSGARQADMSIADDLAKVVATYAHLKRTGTTVDAYLSQIPMFERQLTPFQEKMLLWVEANGRKSKVVRETLGTYADGVVNAAPMLERQGKQELWNAAIKRTQAAKQGQLPLEGAEASAAGVEGRPAVGKAAAETSPIQPAPSGESAFDRLIREQQGGIRFPKAGPPAPAPGSPMAEMAKAHAPAPSPKLGERVEDWWWRLQRSKNYFSRSEALQRRLGKKVKGAIGAANDFISYRRAGLHAFNQGVTRVNSLIARVEREFPNVQRDDIIAYWDAKHFPEILTQHPGRALPGNVTPAIATDTLVQLRQRLGQDGYARLEGAVALLEQGPANALAREVAAGLVKPENAARMRSFYPNYFPLYYRDRGASRASVPKVVGISSNGIYALGDVGLDATVLDPLEAMAHYMIQAEIRVWRNKQTRTFVQLFKDAEVNGLLPAGTVRQERLPAVPSGQAQLIPMPELETFQGRVTFFKDGDKESWFVAPWAQKEIEVAQETFRHPVVTFIGATNRILKVGATKYNPAFLPTNMLADMFAGFIREGIIPGQSWSRIVRGLGDIEKDVGRLTYALSGGYGETISGSIRTVLSSKIRDSGGTVARSFKQVGRVIQDVVPRVQEAVEQSVRLTVWEKHMDRFYPGWRAAARRDVQAVADSYQAHVAAAKALEATVPFGIKGTLTAKWDPILPFLNAAVQGTLFPFRALRDSPGARWRLGGVLAASVPIQMYNMSRPEYFDIPDDVRWGSFVIMLPPTEKKPDGTWYPRYVAVLPRAREWSLFFGPMTYALERFWKSNPEDFAHFNLAMVPLVSPVDWFPVPSIVEELAGQIANYDFFRSRPIVSEDLENLPRSEQFDPWTSRSSQLVGRLTGTSPKRIDHALSGIFGGSSYAATSVSDWILKELMPKSHSTELEALLDGYEDLETPTERRAYMTQLQPDQRKALEAALREPEQRVPIGSGMLARVYRKKGQVGQLRRTGEAVAKRVTALDPEQTRRFGKLLQDELDIQLDEQHQNDTQVESGQKSYVWWRQQRSDAGARLEGVLQFLGTQYPKAAQAPENQAQAEEYYRVIATVADSMPDLRSRSQLLWVAYNAIQPASPQPTTIDLRRMMQDRQKFVDGLSADSKALLQEERNSRATRLEQEWMASQTALRPYWDVAASLIGTDANLEMQYQEYLRRRDEEGSHSATVYKNMRGHEALRRVVTKIDAAEDKLRRQNAQIDFLLVKWFGGVAKNREVMRAQRQLEKERLPALDYGTPLADALSLDSLDAIVTAR
uniref:Large polyvalent protein associated domain-containing protein n=1 Tax=viral metagenome TaxID=1070528 RepID=A0A6M3J1Z0_9ZZZZ